MVSIPPPPRCAGSQPLQQDRANVQLNEWAGRDANLSKPWQQISGSGKSAVGGTRRGCGLTSNARSGPATGGSLSFGATNIVVWSGRGQVQAHSDIAAVKPSVLSEEGERGRGGHGQDRSRSPFTRGDRGDPFHPEAAPEAKVAMAGAVEARRRSLRISGQPG